ncbi:MAG: hypothetical protein FWG10_03835 [Eubacteriaceae bacterium]|nr:hypothetical protein [Eubacteriaceae bacterium]
MRKTGGFHQVVEMLYREPPYERATDRLQIHNLELDKYRKAVDEPASPLQCWLSAICRSQDSQKPLKEVVEMDPKLNEYACHDEGFAQFIERHGFVAATPEVRKAYRRWQYDVMLDKLHEERMAQEQERQLAEGIAEAKIEARAEGKAEGRAEGKEEIIRLLIANEIPDVFLEKMAAEAGISKEKLKELKNVIMKEDNSK